MLTMRKSRRFWTKFLLSASLDGTVCVWNVEDLVCPARTINHGAKINAIAVASNVLYVADISNDIARYIL